MTRRLIVRRETVADITEAALWYDEREKGLGLELTLEVRTAIRARARKPVSPPATAPTPTGPAFSYRIPFIVRDDALVVFAVIHTARHDRHWWERL